MPDLVEPTEITDMWTDSMKAVEFPANRVPWLLLKAEEPMTETQAGLAAADAQQEKIDGLIKAAKKDDDKVDCPTCKGKGAILAGNRKCPDCGGDGQVSSDKADDMAKAELSSKQMNDLPDSSFAHVEPGGKKDDEGKTTPRDKRHFVIKDAQGKPDESHIRNALARVGQGAAFSDQAMPKIKAAAKEAGIEMSKSEFPELSDDEFSSMTKAMSEGKSMAELPPVIAKLVADTSEFDAAMSRAKEQVTELAAMTKAIDDTEDPANEAPGSSAWEAQDAANLRQTATLLAQVKTQIENSSDRERVEGQVDPDDFSQAWDLDDACCLLDAALGIVAAMAFKEQQESTDAAAMEGQMVKAGKRLSSKSKTAITTAQSALADAHKSLTDLLGTDEEEGSPDKTEEVEDMNKAELMEVLDERDEKFLKSIDERFAALKPEPAVETETETKPAEDLAKSETEEGSETQGTETKAAEELTKSESTEVAELKATLAEQGELLKSTAAAVAEIGSSVRVGGPALNELAGRALQRNGVAASEAEDLYSRFTKAETPAEREQLGAQLTEARMREAGVLPQPKATSLDSYRPDGRPLGSV